MIITFYHRGPFFLVFGLFETAGFGLAFSGVSAVDTDVPGFGDT